MDPFMLAGALLVWFTLVWDHRHPEHRHIWEDEE